jgi:hypothetical protein
MNIGAMEFVSASIKKGTNDEKKMLFVLSDTMPYTISSANGRFSD